MSIEFTRPVLVYVFLLGCGGSSRTQTETPPQPVRPSAPDVGAQHVREEQTKHDEIVEKHREIEDEQQTALAATCDDPEPASKHERCLPSCYTTEPRDARAGKKLTGTIDVEHVVCEPREEGAPYVVADEIEGTRLKARQVRGRVPPAHKKGSWQAAIETALASEPHAKGDTFVVTTSWRQLTHPLTHERLRCVTVSHFTRAVHGLDGCGAASDVACEATGNPAARGINVVHYRLAEARQLQAAGKLAECQQAALEAIAVSRGMPRWRQYAKLNVEHWPKAAAYRTRFDGTLDEDALFAAAATLGSAAESVYAACGGPAGAPTKPDQEQSFHSCW